MGGVHLLFFQTLQREVVAPFVERQCVIDVLGVAGKLQVPSQIDRVARYSERGDRIPEAEKPHAWNAGMTFDTLLQGISEVKGEGGSTAETHYVDHRIAGFKILPDRVDRFRNASTAARARDASRDLPEDPEACPDAGPVFDRAVVVGPTEPDYVRVVRRPFLVLIPRAIERV
jgi:hypothetical protein